MNELDTLTGLMYKLSIPSERLPGHTFPEGLSRVYGMIIGQYLGVSDEELLEDLLSTGEVASSDHMDIGRAFCCAMLRSSGNAYATPLVVGVLKDYDGREVTQKVASLLKVLEHYLARSGDITKKDP